MFKAISMAPCNLNQEVVNRWINNQISIWAAALLHHKFKTTAAIKRQKMPIKIKTWANQTLCNLAWIRYHRLSNHHTLTVLLRNRLQCKINNKQIKIKIRQTRDPKKKFNWFKHINSTLKGWKTKPKLTKRAGHNQDPSTQMIEQCNNKW